MKVFKNMYLLLFAAAGIYLSAAEAQAAPEAAVTEAVEQDISVHTQEAGTDSYLRGLFDSYTVYFRTGEWEIQDASFVMNYAVSQLIDNELSYYTVYLNQTPVYTRSFADDAARTGEITFTLPPETVQTDAVNGITVETYLRRKGSEGCVDEAATACWMNIFAESRVEIRYKANNRADTIADFYRKFTSVEAMDSRDSMVAVQEGSNDRILTAMARILSGISQNAPLDYGNIRCSVIKSAAGLEAGRYVIYLCDWDEVPNQLRARMNETQRRQAEEKTLLCLLDLDNGGKVLLIAGKDEDGLTAAGNLLSNAAYMEQLQTDAYVPSDQDAYIMEEEPAQQYSPLTQNGVQVKGLFKQEASFTVEYPAGRRLAAGSQLSLDFRYSDNLDFAKSLLTVYVNDVPVGSCRLSEKGADGSTEMFEIPARLELTGDFTIRVVFDLEAGDNWCELTAEEAPWGYVEDTSMLKLASTESGLLVFENYPYPFIKDGQMNQVSVILPKEPETIHIQAMGKLLLTMGRYLKNNRGELKVSTVCNPAELTDANVILIGEPEEFWRLAGGVLEPAFSYTGTKDGGGMPAYAGITSGYAQLLENPWSELFHGMLLLTGSDEKGLLCPLEYLGDTGKLWELSGDAFLTDGKSIFTVKTPEKKEESEAPIRESGQAEQAAEAPVLFIAAFVALALLAGIMLLARYRKERGGNEK